MLRYDTEITVRFEDADPAGVVFYPRALALAHAAVEEMIRRSALGWEEWFASKTHAAPLRRAEADFFLPMRAGERFTARASVEKIGDTSVEFSVAFANSRDEVAAKIRTVHVLVDSSTGRPKPLADAMRAAFAGGPVRSS
ncbi:MAG: acyl-CoA thioesterase [Chthoniobacterales bacterium]|nr:acyl-CoA thioesterase [Chthoniobacterales bacterium]